MSKRPNDSSDPGPSASRARVEEPAPAEALASRMEKVLFSETSADVHFIVGNPEKGNVERIPAIVAILCAASDVFKTMFLGSFETPTEVDVPDAEPAAFKVILRYIYTDEMLLNMEDAIGILYLAKKYMLKPLVDGTARYIAEHLTTQNVYLFLDCADVLDDIKEKCWDLIESKTTEVVHSEAFLQLSAQQLSEIVKRNTLCIDEIELYERVSEWAQAQLRKNEVEPTPAAIRDVLGDALFGIRFPLMDPKEFSSKVAKSGLLTADEALEVFLWHSIQDKPKSFLCEARANGRVRLKLDLRALVAGSLALPQTGKPHKIGDVAWSIRADRGRVYARPDAHGLSFHLRCHGVPDEPEWRRPAYALMRIVAQVPGVDDLCKTIGHTFTPKEEDWGFMQFAQCDDLLDATKGFLIEGKYVELIVDVFTKDCAPPSIVALCTTAQFD